MARMDRKLVASKEQYGVSYFAQKHRVSATHTAKASQISDELEKIRPPPNITDLQRAPSVDAAVAATAERIDCWHTEVALLRGYVVASRLGAAERRATRLDCLKLLQAFEEAATTIGEETPKALRLRGRVIDIERVLLGLKVATEEVIERLDSDGSIAL